MVRRFVFLWHEVPAGGERPSHFDLMFEQKGGLRTWAVKTLPRKDGGFVRAKTLPLHRVDYLEYEGEVSGGRGRVTRVATGVFETAVDRPERVVFELQTLPYRGRLVFQSLSTTSQLFAEADWEVCLESLSIREMGKSEAR